MLQDETNAPKIAKLTLFTGHGVMTSKKKAMMNEDEKENFFPIRKLSQQLC